MFGLFSAEKIREARKDFPVLKDEIYFDNACMSLKPIQVINKLNEYYTQYTACLGRSNHAFARKLTEEIDKARSEVRKFINAKEDSEIIFTRNTTEGINLIANSFGLKKEDEVIISDKEHNSNLIPWLKLKKTAGIKVVISKTNDDGTFNLENFRKSFSGRTRLVSVIYTSNIDGVTNPVKEIIKISHLHKVPVLVDAAQAVPSFEVDVRKIDADFLAFSGHKMCGPSGIGVLYGKKQLLEKLDQFLVGGETVQDSTYDSYIPEKIPNKFEAGLQDYAGIIGLGEACRYLRKIGMNNISRHEIKLNALLTNLLNDEIDTGKIKILGPKDTKQRGGIFSFIIEGIDIHHVSRILDSSKKIMTRSGAHCVHSWFNARNLNGSVRASLYFYNTEDEVRKFAEEIQKIIKLG
ncbi:TPA: cysteine desulfurase [Candidatus Woesearchaeota archaeon]|nr:cysteine desulfurase [Candidatus Woesearchaeota archaeon]HIH39462.1 cysteine desulfurase [Candidatus Woesearchaeota archaeon]